MNNEVISLWDNTAKADLPVKLIPCCADDAVRPTVLVLPGGAYMCYGERERENVARRFNLLGFHAFVLEYSLSPRSHYPQMQQDVWRAIKLLRQQAERFHLIPDKIALCGFSAGGHLAACAGILPEIPDPADDLPGSGRPDALILGYPVISMEPEIGHVYSFKCLTGKETADPELMRKLSLEKQVDEHSAPAFIWTIADDAVVNPENSLHLAKALWQKQIKCELHIFSHGIHGIGLSEEFRDVARWPELAAAFLRNDCGF